MALTERFNAFFLFTLLLISYVVQIIAFAPSQENKLSFSVELVHKDSPNSPFSNPSTTSWRLSNVLVRPTKHIGRYNRSLVSMDTAQSSLLYGGNGDYLMRMSIGTPPTEILAIVVINTNLLWTQCEPCTTCFGQATPVFNPKTSLTFKTLGCDSPQCSNQSYVTFCNSSRGSCRYTNVLGGATYTAGVLAVDTVTLDSLSGQPFSLPNTVFGCGTNNQGNFNGASGMVGFGRGPTSLISRMDWLIGGKFSYCLAPYFSTRPGKINFGGESVVSGPDVTSTHLVPRDHDAFYSVTLQAISVESERIEFSSAYADVNSVDVLIETGTTLTYLPSEFYRRLESTVRKFIPLEAGDSPAEEPMSVCYNPNAVFHAPAITMHFAGADVKLSELNTFITMSGDVACLAFAPNDDDQIAVYGNVQQTNFLLGYDLRGNTLSFKQTDCTKY